MFLIFTGQKFGSRFLFHLYPIANSDMMSTLTQCVICPQNGGGRLREFVHARAIYNVLTQGRTV